MKKGFTLAETLVTLGIVGIIVAITIPGFMKIRPDKMKIQYLKAYDALEQAVKDLANNTRLYPLAGTIINNGTDNYDFSKYPLANIYNNVEKVESKILNGSTTITKTSELPNELKNAKGNTKFCKALAWELGENGENCKDDGETKNSFTDPSFTTKNGMVWVVTQDIDLQDTAVTSQESSFATTVQVDVNGAEGPNAFYSANTQPNPDRFTFLVQADGIVTPADPMGQTYLDSRKAFLSKNVSSEASQKTTYTWWDKTKAKTDYDKDPEFVLEKIVNTASINNGSGNEGSGNEGGSDHSTDDNLIVDRCEITIMVRINAEGLLTRDDSNDNYGDVGHEHNNFVDTPAYMHKIYAEIIPNPSQLNMDLYAKYLNGKKISNTPCQLATISSNRYYCEVGANIASSINNGFNVEVKNVLNPKNCEIKYHKYVFNHEVN